MNERFAVVFRNGSAESAGALEVRPDRLLLRGRANQAPLELEIPFSDLFEVRRGRRSSERLHGYATLILERAGSPPVLIAPLGMAMLSEVADLLVSLDHRATDDVLTVLVPLKRGCVGRARKLLVKGPPFDPSSLGLDAHEVYLRDGEAVFVFRGSNVRARVATAIRYPSMWRAGLAWQSCIAAPPQIVETGDVSLDDAPAYSWTSPTITQSMRAEPEENG